MIALPSLSDNFILLTFSAEKRISLSTTSPKSLGSDFIKTPSSSYSASTSGMAISCINSFRVLASIV